MLLRSQLKRWVKKEKQDEREFGGRRTPRSGGLWGFKGDIRNDKFLFESKDTEKEGFRITRGLWNKIYGEALKSRRLPILSIRMKDTDIVVLDKNDFLELIRWSND